MTKPLAHSSITDHGQPAADSGWTPHDLRHSALTHAAENSADTGTLLACSGHACVASLARRPFLPYSGRTSFRRTDDRAGTEQDADDRVVADCCKIPCPAAGSVHGCRLSTWAWLKSRAVPIAPDPVRRRSGCSVLS
jgi:hypothetical protein